MWAWMAAAIAGSVFINDVHVEPSELAGMNFENVSVTMDAAGNVHIKAPQYTVRLATVPTTPVAPVKPVPPRMATEAPVPGPNGVPAGRWWLYIHDQASTGHEVKVIVNDAIVKTVRSGDVVIQDIGRFLFVGSNAVRLQATSTNPTGGPLYVYVGQGQDVKGTVDLGTPDIQFSFTQSRQGVTEQEFTLQVAP